MEWVVAGLLCYVPSHCLVSPARGSATLRTLAMIGVAPLGLFFRSRQCDVWVFRRFGNHRYNCGAHWASLQLCS